MPQGNSQLRSFNTLRSKVSTAEIRREMLQNKEHLVVPIVALVEGVLQGANSASPELALASEFAKFPMGWNGRPVTLDHPQRDGGFVSASSTPTVFEEEALGFLFNSRLDGKKLKVEAWINLEAVENASQQVKDEVARLEAGEVVEVSTGLFTETEVSRGRYNSKQYEAVWRDVVPDHLAILPLGTIGACSVADGCGARVNMKVNCQCQEHEETQEDPNVNTETQEDEPENVSLERNRFLRGLRDKFAGVFKLINNSAAGELSDIDTRAAIKAALKLEDDQCWFDVVAVFNTSFVYSHNWDGTLYERSYSISSTGVVSLGTDKSRVRPETTFVPITTTEETRMSKKEKVDALITNSATQFAEADRAWLETMEEAQLDKLSPITNTEGTDNGQSTTVKKVKETPATEVVDEPKGNAAPVTADAYLAAAPAEIRSVLENGLKMHNARTDTLVKGLLANSRNTFTEVELRAMSSDSLEKLAKVANIPDYSGAAGSSIVTNSSSNDVPAAPKVFTAKQA